MIEYPYKRSKAVGRHTMIEYPYKRSKSVGRQSKAVGRHTVYKNKIDILLLDDTVLYQPIWHKCQQRA